jgi:hypothetical protein
VHDFVENQRSEHLIHMESLNSANAHPLIEELDPEGSKYVLAWTYTTNWYVQIP